MAARGGERRLVFDVRGKRRHVVRFVYAILALLMASSLFFVVGPFNLGSLFGRGSVTPASKLDDEQAERIERQLAANPKDKALLLSLIQARIRAGGAKEQVSSEGATPTVTPASREEFEAAQRLWRRYLKQAGPSIDPAAAFNVATMSWLMAQSSTTYREAEEGIRSAAQAQAVYAKAHPNLNSLSTLAKYTFLSFDYPKAERIGREAAARAVSKEERNKLATFLKESKKLALGFQKGAKAAAKEERKRGKESLQNPFGGLAGSSGSLGGP